MSGYQPSEDDLAGKVTTKVVGVVDRLNAVTAKPLTLIARGLVFGTLGAVLAVATLVLLTIGALRGLDILIPGEVWSAHLALGSVFTLGGLLLWIKRKPARR
jgi:hypothetical protein